MLLNPLVLAAIFVANNVCSKSVEEYMATRNQILETENSHFLGSDLELSSEENLFNVGLMGDKIEELTRSFFSSEFLPAQWFYLVKDQIEASSVFQTIRSLPKGGVLHIHEFAITSGEWVIKNVTYRDNLWMCVDPITTVLHFGWYSGIPESTDDCHWMEVKQVRLLMGSENFDKMLQDHLTIITDDPANVYPNVNAVWAKFSRVFSSLMGLLGYAPVAKDYFYEGFKEFMEDNVNYMEFRTVLPKICPDMDNCDNPLTKLETAKLMKEVADQFILDHPNDMCGIRIIYAPSRFVNSNKVEEYLDTASELMAELPEFVAGFDLVGQEDKGMPLIDFIEPLLNKTEGKNLPVFFHAGETDWQGQSTDLNLIDALMLNTTRIGHGYAIAKHPEAKKMAINQDVPLEVSPISNQVLNLVVDLRNHPAAILIQEGFPVIISADDPGLWGSKGLSYDFYEAFMAMSSQTMDLRLLKKFALNSLHYVTLGKEKKDKCQAMFTSKWNSVMSNYSRTPKISIL